MFRPPRVSSSSSGWSRGDRIERDLATMAPGQRRFFELVIGITHILFVPVWLLLCAGWAWRSLVLILAHRAPGSPRRARPPLPDLGDVERLGALGYGLYLAGAYIAVVLGLLSMIGLCFLPVLTVFWVVSALEQEGTARAVAGTLGAASLEGLMLWVYFRYMRGVLARS